MAQRMGKLLITHRVRRDHIERATQIVIQQPDDRIDHIINMDPGQILTSVTDGAAQTKAKRRNHFSEDTARRCQYDTGTQQAYARVIALRAAGNLLPPGAELMGKFIVRRFFFRDDDFT